MRVVPRCKSKFGGRYVHLADSREITLFVWCIMIDLASIEI